ncbi:MAG: Rossmann-like and DUF2520 domain-containing protein [Acidobacteriota bacterium]
MDRTFTLIGCGKAGLSVALALKGSGWRVEACASRTPESARTGAEWLACPVLPSLNDLPREGHLLLGVPDTALRDVDRAVAASDPYLRGRVVLHLSGALPARILESCRLRGASVGSIHPIMTLPDPLTGAKNLRQATFALEGRPDAMTAMKAMVQSMSGKSFTLSPRGKTLYHAAAVVAANHLVALIADSQEMLRLAGADPSVSLPAFQSLMVGTVSNVFASGPVAAITGPIERSDQEIIRNHLQALKRWPRLSERYRAMALGALGLVRERHPERREALDALEKALSGWHSSP